VESLTVGEFWELCGTFLVLGFSLVIGGFLGACFFDVLRDVLRRGD